LIFYYNIVISILKGKSFWLVRTRIFQAREASPRKITSEALSAKRLAQFLFGTYKIPKSEIARYIVYCRNLGITRIDTAQLYRNEKQVTMSINDDEIVQIKVDTFIPLPNFKKEIKRSIRQNKRCGILLHHVAQPDYWHILETIENLQYIGVSNYNVESLEKLLLVANKKPTINQIEIHPFVDSSDIIEFCKLNDIKVQAHSVLAGGRYFDHPVLIDIARKYEKTVPQIMVRWVYQLDVDICISSTIMSEITELLDIDFTLSKLDHSLISNLKNTEYAIRLYPFRKMFIENSEEYQMLIEGFKKYINTENIHDIGIPIEWLKYSPNINSKAGSVISITLFPEQPEKYTHCVKRLRLFIA